MGKIDLSFVSSHVYGKTYINNGKRYVSSSTRYVDACGIEYVLSSSGFNMWIFCGGDIDSEFEAEDSSEARSIMKDIYLANS